MNHIPTGLSRRGVLGVAAGSALTAMLAACSNDSSSSKSSSSGTAASGAAAGGKFPQSVPGLYGKVTVAAQPKTVVSLDPALADMCVALGVQPVAVALTDKDPVPYFKGRLTGKWDGAIAPGYNKPSIERIASYKPDLVLCNEYEVHKDNYPKVAKVAPTYPTRGNGAGQWKTQLLDLSLLLTGGTQKAEEVQRQIAQNVDDAKKTIPNLQGKTFLWLAALSDGISVGDGSSLEMFGLKAGALQGAENTMISYENLTKLDVDILYIWALDEPAKKKMEADPRFAQLPASKNGAVLWASTVEAAALNTASPTPFKWVAENVVPKLAKTPLNTKG